MSKGWFEHSDGKTTVSGLPALILMPFLGLIALLLVAFFLALGAVVLVVALIAAPFVWLAQKGWRCGRS